MKDFVALVADKNTEFGLRGLLARHGDLGIRPIAHDIIVHPERDPGCLLRSHDFLRPFHKEYGKALVLFDREGCGRSTTAPSTWPGSSRNVSRPPVGPIVPASW